MWARWQVNRDLSDSTSNWPKTVADLDVAGDLYLSIVFFHRKGLGLLGSFAPERPVRRYDGVALGDGKVPGPVTRRLTAAFIEEAGFDFVAQYLRHLE